MLPKKMLPNSIYEDNNHLSNKMDKDSKKKKKEAKQQPLYHDKHQCKNSQ